MHFNGIYDRPLVHLGPYIVGIFFGYFTIKAERIRLHPLINAFGWLTSIVLFALLMMSSFKLDSVNPWVKHSFATISHTFWSLVLLWICFASMSDRAGVFLNCSRSHFRQKIIHTLRDHNGCHCRFYCGIASNSWSVDYPNQLPNCWLRQKKYFSAT